MRLIRWALVFGMGLFLLPLGEASSTQSVFYTGSLEPVERHLLLSPALGRMKTVSVSYGARVKSGELLWEIESVDLDHQLREAQVEQLQGDHDSESMMHSWRAQVQRAKMQKERARNRAQGSETLFKNGIIAQEEWQHDQDALKEATLWLEEAQASLKQAENQKNKVQAKVSMLRQENAAARVAVLLQKKEALILKAPFNGILLPPPKSMEEVLGSPSLQAGLRVQADQVLAVLAKEGAYQTILLVDELDIAQIREGLSVQAYLQAFPRTLLRGKVSRVSAHQDHHSGGQHIAKYGVCVDLDPLPEEIQAKARYGMQVVVELELLS